MQVLVTEATFHLDHCHSLKDKRQIRRKLLDGLRIRFSATATEVADHHRPKILSVAWASVGGEVGPVQAAMDRSLDWAVTVAGDPVALRVDFR